MAKKRESGLGRGLDALMGGGPSSLLEQSEGSGITTLPIAKVEAYRKQPRKQFDEASLQDLADSIRRHGILQPLTVRKLSSGYYQIIAGERRWRAARQAGLNEVPVLVIEADDRKMTELSLIENLQREDLDPIEEAEGYKTLMDNYHLTQEEAAERVGKSRSAVANSLRLLGLCPEVRQMLQNSDLSGGHARALLPLKADLQLDAANLIVKQGLSVRQTEALAKRLSNPKEERKPTNDELIAKSYGRLAAQELSDKIGRRPTDLILFGASLGLSAAFLFAQGWAVVAVYASLTFCYSALAAVLPALSTDLFGLPHAGVNYGFLALGQSVGSLAFPFAANLWGLETGRHWLAMGGAAAGFAAIWALQPVQPPRPPKEN